MNLDLYVGVAQILGVAAVFVTLIFLTVQIRQYTRAARATTIQSALQAELDVAAMFLANAGTWDKIMTGAEISEGEEMRRAIGLYNVFMIDTENRFLQYRAGYLAETSWQGRMSTLPAVIDLPIFPLWRPTVGALSRSADFLELIDGIASGHRARGAPGSPDDTGASTDGALTSQHIPQQARDGAGGAPGGATSGP